MIHLIISYRRWLGWSEERSSPNRLHTIAEFGNYFISGKFEEVRGVRRDHESDQKREQSYRDD